MFCGVGCARGGASAGRAYRPARPARPYRRVCDRTSPAGGTNGREPVSLRLHSARSEGVGGGAGREREGFNAHAGGGDLITSALPRLAGGRRTETYNDSRKERLDKPSLRRES